MEDNNFDFKLSEIGAIIPYILYLILLSRLATMRYMIKTGEITAKRLAQDYSLYHTSLRHDPSRGHDCFSGGWKGC